MLKSIMSALAIAACIGFFSDSQALPTLQLGIEGGTYDINTETTFSDGDLFTLYAYLIPDTTNIVNDIYYISAALTPKTVAGGSFGSFVFNGDTVQVTSGMIYGNPPVNELYNDLGSHDIFDTYYKEISFAFAGNSVTVPNVEGGIDTASGYRAAFNVDTRLLAAGYEIHFDLYNENIKNNSYVTPFASFSHDAESRGAAPVPEPATMLLFGAGLAGLVGLGRRRKN